MTGTNTKLKKIIIKVSIGFVYLISIICIKFSQNIMLSGSKIMHYNYYEKTPKSCTYEYVIIYVRSERLYYQRHDSLAFVKLFPW